MTNSHASSENISNKVCLFTDKAYVFKDLGMTPFSIYTFALCARMPVLDV